MPLSKYREITFILIIDINVLIFMDGVDEIMLEIRGGDRRLYNFSYAGPQQSPGKPSPHPIGVCFVAEVVQLRKQGSGLSGRCPSLFGYRVGGPGVAMRYTKLLLTSNIPSIHILPCSTGTPLIFCVVLAHYSLVTVAVTAAMPYGKSNPKRGQESLGKALQRRRALERAEADRY